jgi:hypothetical protein
MPRAKKPKETPTKRRIDMSAMEPAADLVRTMFKKADKKLADKLETEKTEDEGAEQKRS